MIIKEELVKKSLDIIVRHDKLLNELSKIQNLLNTTSEHLMIYKEKIDNIENDSLNDKQKLYDIFLKYETEIRSLKNDTKPYIEDMEKLKKEASSLYLKIKELFPTKSEEDIKDILKKDLDEYKELNNI